MVEHRSEIFSRPKRTWFQSEKEKKAAQALSSKEKTGGKKQKSPDKLTHRKKRKQVEEPEISARMIRLVCEICVGKIIYRIRLLSVHFSLSSSFCDCLLHARMIKK